MYVSVYILYMHIVVHILYILFVNNNGEKIVENKAVFLDTI